MKKILMIISLVSIFLIGIFVCYEEVKANEGNNGYKQVNLNFIISKQIHI